MDAPKKRWDVIAAVAILSIVWSLLLVGGVLARWMGPDLATVASFGAATVLAITSRPRAALAAPRACVAVAFAAGLTGC